MNKNLMVGTCRLMITPPFGCEMSGFVARNGLCKGIHDPLWARALIINNGHKKIALVVTDLIGIDGEILNKVRQLVSYSTDITPDSVLIAATHTHSGPAVLQKAFLGKPDPNYITMLIKNISGAILLANQSLEPVRLFVGESKCNSIGKNRLKKGGPTDPQVLVLRLENDKGIKVLIVNYACHPVVLGPDNLLITADYPYYLISSLEQVYPKAQIMFINGATGDINVGHITADSIKSSINSKRTFEEAGRLGRLLAGEVIKATETAVLQEIINIRFCGRKISLPLEPIPSFLQLEEACAGWKRYSYELKKKQASYGEIQQAKVWAEWAEKIAGLAKANRIIPEINTELAVFSIGGVDFVSFPGEFFHEFGLKIKKIRTTRKVFIIGYCNDNIGYVAPSSVYEEGGYEVEDSYRYYGLPSRLVKDAGLQVVQLLERMLQGY